MLDYKTDLFPYQEGHQMEYLDEYDEWRCSECGRIVKIIGGKREVVVTGNLYATHSGSKGLVVGNIEIVP